MITERQRERIEDLLRGEPQSANRLLTWQLVIGEEDPEDVTERVVDLEYGTDEGPALVLEATVAGEVRSSREHEPVMLSLLYDGVPVRQFTGTLQRPVHGRTTSEIRAGSSGFWLSRIFLKSHTTFTGVPPDLVLYDMLSRAPYRGNVEVEPVGMPLFRRVEEPFLKTDTPDDVIEALQAEVSFEIYDTPDDGAEAVVERSLSEGGDASWTFEVGRDVEVEDFTPERRGEAYAEVWVTRRIENATGDPVEVLAEVPVPGSKAPPDTVLEIESSDYTEGAVAAAIATAYDEASALAFGRYDGSFETAYIQPFLRRGKLVAVKEPGEDARGRYVRTWMCLLSETRGRLPEKRGEYGGVMEVVGKEYEPALIPAPQRRSGGVFFPLLGRDWLYRAYLSTALPFVAYDEATGEAVVDADAAAQHGVNVYMDEATMEVVVESDAA